MIDQRHPAVFPPPRRSWGRRDSLGMYAPATRGQRLQRWLLRRSAAGLWWVARKAVAKRRRLAPFYAGAGLWLAGMVLAGSPDGRSTALFIAVGGGVAAVGWWWRNRRRWPRLRTLYVTVSYAAAAAWLQGAAAAGPTTPPLPGFLLVGVPLLAAPYLWHTRIRPVPSRAEAVQVWEERVAGQGGKLPDSGIEDPQPVTYTPLGDPCASCGGIGTLLAQDGQPCETCGGAGHRQGQAVEVGWRTEGWLPRGRLDTEHAIQATRWVASAFGVPAANVAIEQTATGEADRFLLQVYARNPLRDVRYWPGPTPLDLASGVCPIGVYLDGQEVLYRFFQPGSGAVHDLVAGTTGAGKSRALDLLLAIERAWGFASVVIDPQHGASLPDWQDRVARYARTEEEGVATLLDMEELMRNRNRELGSFKWEEVVRGELRKHKGIGFFDLQHEVMRALGLPFICFTIDEAHDILRYTEALRAAEAIAKMARKCGIKLRLCTQVPTVDQLGGSGTLREMVASGNVLVLRTGSRMSGQVAFQGVLPVDPVTLPRYWPDGSTTAGLCYALGEQARTAQARLWLPGDTYFWANHGPTVPLPELAHLVQPGTPTPNGERPAIETAPVDPVAVNASARDRAIAYLRQQGRPVKLGAIARDLNVSLSALHNGLTRARTAGLVEPGTRPGTWQAVNPTTNNGGPHD